MCDIEIGALTLVGRRRDLLDALERWRDLPAVAAMGLGLPQFYDLAKLGDAYASDNCSAVARVETPMQSPLVAAPLIQFELATLGLDIACEPAFSFGPATSANWAAGGSLTWNSPGRYDEALRNLPNLTNTAANNDIAILDSGWDNSAAQMFDVVNQTEVVEVTAIDDDGHGTAVTNLIEAAAKIRNKAANVKVYRVMTAGRGESHELFNAMALVLWHNPGYGIVNASVTTGQQHSDCASSLGGSLTRILRDALADGKTLPKIVAAEGNWDPTRASQQPLGYPARMPSVTVARALDWNGQDAPYCKGNVTGLTVASAMGGLDGDPLGTRTLSNGTSEQIFGTSFAAAFITASMLP